MVADYLKAGRRIAPNVDKFTEEGYLRWDSLGEFLGAH
jgi:monomeric isocitrate dehydrogenase